MEEKQTMRELLAAHGFTFSKALGQNFITDPHICPKMADISGADSETGVLEIGPGMGVLTKELSKRAKKVVAVELDSRLIPILQETLADCPNTKVVEGDAMKIDLKALLAAEFPEMRVVVCANLPYYITSPVVMRLLTDGLMLSQITVMVQKEAADRLCAAPGTRACGAVSAAIAYYAKAEKCFAVPRGCFFPIPNVDSQVIAFYPHTEPPVAVADEDFFFRVTRGAFEQRRKTLCNSLSSALSLPKGVVQAAIENAGLPPACRAENLTLEEFARLAAILRG